MAKMERHREAYYEVCEYDEKEGKEKYVTPFVRKYIKVVSYIHRIVDNTMEFLGYFNARFPILAILFVIVTTILLAFFGMREFYQENRSTHIYLDQESEFTKEHFRMMKDFPVFPVNFYFISPPEQPNGATVEGLEKLFYLYGNISDSNRFPKYNELCVKSNEPGRSHLCEIIDSPTLFWNNNYTLFQQMVQTDEDVRIQMSSPTFPTGQYVSRRTIFARPVTNESNNELVSCRGFQMILLINGESTKETAPAEKELVEYYLNEFRQSIKASGWDVTLSSFYSFSEEIDRNATQDIPIMFGTYLIMFIFFTLTLGRYTFVRFRSSLALGGILAIVFSILSGFMLGMLSGAPYIALNSVSPLVLVGTGVDSMYVVVSVFDKSRKSVKRKGSFNDWITERMKKTMRLAGASVLLTSMTSMAAFFVGTLSSIPSLEYFTLYCALAQMMIFIYTLIGFPALVILDSRRQNANRPDCFCCFKLDANRDNDPEFEVVALEMQSSETNLREKLPGEEGNAKKAGRKKVESSDNFNNSNDKKTENEVDDEAETKNRESTEPINSNKSGDVAPKEKKSFSLFFGKTYFNFLMKPRVKVFVLITFIVFFFIFLYFSTLVEQKFDTVESLPFNSYLRDMATMRDEYFPGFFNTLQVVFTDINYEDEASQKAMVQFVNETYTNSPFISPPSVCWIEFFRQFYLAHPLYNTQLNPNGYLTNVTLFYEAFNEFNISSKGAFSMHIKLNDQGRIKVSRCLLQQHDVFNVYEQEDVVEHANNMKNNAPPELIGNKDGPPFLYHFFMPFWELYTLMEKQMVQNVFISAVVVFAICVILLYHPLVSFYLFIIMIMIDVDIYGLMYFWNLNINPITVTILVMTVGIAVDYPAHIAHAYLEFIGTPEKRVQQTLYKMGAPVLLGGLSTFLGIILLSQGNSEPFKVFFKELVSIVLVALSHGLIFFPVLLSMVGPKAYLKNVE